MSEVLAIICVLVWLYLIVGRGGFWLCRIRDMDSAPERQKWPSVVAVVPARNEADHIAVCVGSLLRQQYAGSF
ncbi:MAG: glycosyl transferase family 2, partial [Pseudolabrys sp.]